MYAMRKFHRFEVVRSHKPIFEEVNPPGGMGNAEMLRMAPHFPQHICVQNCTIPPEFNLSSETIWSTSTFSLLVRCREYIEAGSWCEVIEQCC